MTRLALIVLAAAVAGTAACGAAGRASVRGTGDSNVITAAELENHRGTTARQAIERLRPRFLRVRGPSSVQNPEADRIVIYVDNARMGGVEILAQLRADDIEEIRYMSAPDATSRYGTGHSAGAIVITRR